MAAGYALGQVYTWEVSKRRALLTRLEKYPPSPDYLLLTLGPALLALAWLEAGGGLLLELGRADL